LRQKHCASSALIVASIEGNRNRQHVVHASFACVWQLVLDGSVRLPAASEDDETAAPLPPSSRVDSPVSSELRGGAVVVIVIPGRARRGDE
jgi:hypothetical protein